MVRYRSRRADFLTDTEKGRKSFAAAYVILVVIVLLAGGIRWRLLDVPLERDEGEYAYAGQLILNGVAPYTNLYNMKLPGVYAAYALILALFGESARAVHIGLLLINAVTTILLYSLARRFLGRAGSLSAAALFAFLSIGIAVQGIFANAEHFVIFFTVAGLLLLLKAVESDRPSLHLTSGLFFGFAFLMKQHAAAFVLLGLAALFVERRSQSGSGKTSGGEGRFSTGGMSALFMAGVCVPYLVASLLFLMAGSFRDFWFWTVTYASRYVSQVPFSSVGSNFLIRFGEVIRHAPLLWALAGIGGAALFLRRWPGERAKTVFLFLLFSFAATMPGFYFRPHYFVLLLPAAAIAGGGVIEAIGALSAKRSEKLRVGVPVICVTLLLILTAFGQRDFLFRMTPEQACRATYGLNPFLESVEIARYLREQTGPDDRIAILGSEPQIFFYSGRRSATGYIYTYALMEKHDFALAMQKEMIAEIEAAKPEYIVYVRNKYSWDVRPDSHKLLVEWFQQYRDAHYELVGLINMFPTNTEYHWNPPVPWPPRSEWWIGILKRES